MNGWLEIAASGPRLWVAILIAAAGLWLSWVAYVRHGRRWLAVFCATAWGLLALWALAPAWRSHPEIWHPPAVWLVTDEGASYAALGARAAGEASRRAARAHYEALGFRVVEAPWNVPGRPVETPPNLQAVLLWSDGRFAADAAVGGEALPSAPVFPVSVPVETREVQGESAFVAPTEGPARALVLTVAWRALGAQATPARAELRQGAARVWSGELTHPLDIPPGARATSTVTLPVPLAALLENTDSAVTLIVRPARPEDNALVANDTVPVDMSRLHRARQAFVRPLTTLHERGLMDALRARGEFRVEAMPVARAAAMPRGRAGSVIWVARARGAALAGAADSNRAVIAYDVHPGAAGTEFGPEARIGRDARAAAFLPAAALRLADLGLGAEDARWKLPSPDENVEALAWAEEGGRRGVLFGRDRARGTYVFAVPPLWDARFRADAARGEGGLGPQWVRGAAAWAGHASRIPSLASRGGETRDVARLRIGEDVEALGALAARSGGRVLRDEGSWPRLPDGQIREARTRVMSLAPPVPLAVLVIALFAGVWYGRKRLQLD